MSDEPDVRDGDGVPLVLDLSGPHLLRARRRGRDRVRLRGSGRVKVRVGMGLGRG